MINSLVSFLFQIDFTFNLSSSRRKQPRSQASHSAWSCYWFVPFKLLILSTVVPPVTTFGFTQSCNFRLSQGTPPLYNYVRDKTKGVLLSLAVRKPLLKIQTKSQWRNVKNVVTGLV